MNYDSSSESSEFSELPTNIITTTSTCSDSFSEFEKRSLKNQDLELSMLGTICFLLIVGIGIYLAYLFGKFIHNLIN